MTRTFPVSAGLLEHKGRMGAAIWEYLWLLDHVTSDEPDGNGKFSGVVQYGNPVKAETVAADLKESLDTAKDNLQKLERKGYVTRCQVAGAGYSYRVTNSKKWVWKRANSHQREANVSGDLFHDSQRGENSAGRNLPVGRGETSTLNTEKPTRARVENSSCNKESKTLKTLGIDRKTSSPGGEADRRHAPLAKYIQQRWLDANPSAPAAPWNARTGKILREFLGDNPSWILEQLQRCVDNRFSSVVNRSEIPAKWIPNLLSYASEIVDRFNKPKEIGHEDRIRNRAQRRQAANLAAREAARASVMAN